MSSRVQQKLKLTFLLVNVFLTIVHLVSSSPERNSSSDNPGLNEAQFSNLMRYTKDGRFLHVMYNRFPIHFFSKPCLNDKLGIL